MAGSEQSKDDRWESYCQIIKKKESIKEIVDLTDSISSKRKRQRAAHLETLGGIESLSHDDSSEGSMEIACKSPVALGEKECLGGFTDKTALSPEVKPCGSIPVLEKTLEEQIRDLSVIPLGCVHQSHVHCEYCGHPMVHHEDHIDFLSDGELHLVSPSGAVYPHKLAISDTNPSTCKLQDFSLDQISPSEEYPLENTIEVNTLITIGRILAYTFNKLWTSASYTWRPCRLLSGWKINIST